MLINAELCLSMLIDAQISFKWVFFCRTVPLELLQSFLNQVEPDWLNLIFKIGHNLGFSSRLYVVCTTSLIKVENQLIYRLRNVDKERAFLKD